jgi:hypothetical protein
MDLRDMENEMFEINIKHEIMMPPMREYDEHWLIKSIIKITETKQKEMIIEVMPPKPQ